MSAALRATGVQFVDTMVIEGMDGGTRVARAGGSGVPGRPASGDVARAAGVSQKTVSRVMNDEPYVREEVRERVLAAARTLGYRPNGAARSLNSGVSRRLGVISLGAGLFGPTTLLVAVERSARQQGYSVIVAHTGEDEEHGAARAVDRLLEQGVDAIVLSEELDEGPLDVTIDVPVLTLGRFPGITASRRIRSSEEPDRSGYVATRHLVDLGHREIRHVAGPSRWWSARDRESGWRTALEEAGLPVVEPVRGDWSCLSGYRAGLRLAADDEATAVFVANDDMAIGLLRALAEIGRAAPEHVSVVGIDDTPAAAFLNPALTTIPQPFEHVATEGVRLLVEAINSADPLDRTFTRSDPILVVRESTRALGSSPGSPLF